MGASNLQVQGEGSDEDFVENPHPAPPGLCEPALGSYKSRGDNGAGGPPEGLYKESLGPVWAAILEKAERDEACIS